MNKRHTSGASAELYVASVYMKKGYNVLFPMATQSRYDFAVEKNGKFKRIQCKKASWSKSGPYKYLQSRISSRNKTSRPKYEKGEFEEFAFTDEAGRLWVFDFDELEGLTSVCLDSDNINYKPQTKYKPEEHLVK